VQFFPDAHAHFIGVVGRALVDQRLLATFGGISCGALGARAKIGKAIVRGIQELLRGMQCGAQLYAGAYRTFRRLKRLVCALASARDTDASGTRLATGLVGQLGNVG
jgi:hypothetical protein